MNKILSLITLLAGLIAAQPSFAIDPKTVQIVQNGLLEPGTSIASNGVTTSVLAKDNPNFYITGTSTHTLAFPDSRILYVGKRFYISNESTGSVTVLDGNGSTIQTLLAGQSGQFRLKANSTAAGSWNISIAAATSSGGTAPYVLKSGDSMSGLLAMGAGGTVTGLTVSTNVSILPGGRMLLTSGSEAAPSLSFNPDQNSGLYRVGEDSIGIAVGGSEVLRVSTSGSVANVIMRGVPSFANHNRAVTVTLSGTSTFISNTTVTANTKAALTSVGASSVAPWLIGISSGVGYSVGASGAGSAHAILVEGQ